jgi:hypothetical protein
MVLRSCVLCAFHQTPARREVPRQVGWPLGLVAGLDEVQELVQPFEQLGVAKSLAAGSDKSAAMCLASGRDGCGEFLGPSHGRRFPQVGNDVFGQLGNGQRATAANPVRQW